MSGRGRVEGGALRTSSWDGVNRRSYWGFGLGRKFTAVCVPYSPALWLSIASVPPTAKPGCVDWPLGACGLQRGRVQIPPGANPVHSLMWAGVDDRCKHCPVLAAVGPRAKFPVLAFCALKRAGTVWPLRWGPFVERPCRRFHHIGREDPALINPVIDSVWSRATVCQKRKADGFVGHPRSM